jgi:hypothetical protein
MLALIAANAVGVILFGTLYAVAGARWLPQWAFLVCLAMVFVIVTMLWVRVESAQGHGREALARLGRIAAALVIVLVAVPPLSLMPVFWLDSQLPPEAGFRPVIAPIMVLVLIALSLTVLVNIAGGLVAGVRGLRGQRTARPRGSHA